MSVGERETNAAKPSRDIRRIQQLLCEVRKPFIQLLVDLYSVSLPAILVQDNAVVEIRYSDWVKELDAKIRASAAERHRMRNVARRKCRVTCENL